MIFQKFNQIKYKTKGGKPLRKTIQEGNAASFASSKSPNGQFVV